MIFIHTADLHIGRRLNDIPLLDDQKHVLNQIVDIAVSESADAILLSGDIYDKSMPGADAMSLFDEFISALVEKNIKVFMISGNHDSSERISYLSDIISKAGIYASYTFDGKLQKIAFDEVDIYLLPYIRPLQVRRFYPDKICGPAEVLYMEVNIYPLHQTTLSEVFHQMYTMHKYPLC